MSVKRGLSRESKRAVYTMFLAVAILPILPFALASWIGEQAEKTRKCKFFIWLCDLVEAVDLWSQR